MNLLIQRSQLLPASMTAAIPAAIAADNAFFMVFLLFVLWFFSIGGVPLSLSIF